MIDLKTPKAHDHADENLKPLLKKIQGNILKGHGRDHTFHLFLRFTAPAEKVRPVLAMIVKRTVKSAAEQQEDTEHRVPGEDGELFGNFFLSRSGYVALGFSEQVLKAALQEKPSASVNASFFDGMKACAAELKDPDPETNWEPGYRGEIHALLLLAHASSDKLEEHKEGVLDLLAPVATVVACEVGGVLRNAQNDTIEHFGYVDGISQPAFFAAQLKSADLSEWDPLAPLDLVLVRDGLVPDDENAFGSFYVFRKLEQNVRGFHERSQALASTLDIKGVDGETVRAMAVGRLKNGVPLPLVKAGQNPADRNAFNFKNDPVGATCPLHAHIRKVNQRGTMARETAQHEDVVERGHRIVRRGVPYGEREIAPHLEQPADKMPERGVGLLFSCFQASIPDQFAFIQAWWVNRPDHADRSGIDPLIGAPHASGEGSWGPNAQHRRDFGQFVTLKGGEFFFAPSVPFLQRL